MADRLLKILADAPEALLVTGGYHARGLTDRLTRAGYAVASVVPKLTNIEGPQGAAYLAVFAQEKTPLDRLFEGPKLFLAAPPASAESLARTELTAGAVAVGREPDGALPGPVRDHLKRTFTVIDGGRKGGVSSVRVRHRGRAIVASFDPTKPGGRKARWGLVGRGAPHPRRFSPLDRADRFPRAEPPPGRAGGAAVRGGRFPPPRPIPWREPIRRSPYRKGSTPRRSFASCPFGRKKPRPGGAHPWKPCGS
jgi:hypothetical protein